MVRKGAAAAVAALLAGGCALASMSRITEDPPTLLYSPTHFIAASSGRDFEVEIQGDPFPVSEAKFAQVVTRAMQAGYTGPATHFTTTPDTSAEDGYRIVLVFNPASGFPNAQLCTGQKFPTKLPLSRGAPVVVQAAYCAPGLASYLTGYTGVATSLSAWLPAAQGLDDPAFTKLIADITLSLLPLRNPNQQPF